ncbi:MAG: hypothetical protein FD179_1337 [Erysipelotrichaceae bacterium]|nr:MAG: hypothetical protein FD179_1337 [Erysipelotrichaceae bacterium]
MKLKLKKQDIKIIKEKVDSKEVLSIQERLKEVDKETNPEVCSNKFSFDLEEVRNSLHFLETGKIETIISVLSTFEVKENKRLHKKVSLYKENIDDWNIRAKAAERSYLDPQYRHNTLEKPKFSKEISNGQLPRLYRILDTLFSIFDQIGEVVTDDLCIKINDDNVSFEMIESTDKMNHEITKAEAQQLVKYNDEVKRHSYASKPHIKKYDYIPNSIFRIKLSNGKYIKDTKENKLEDMLPDIVLLFYQCYFEIRTNREAQERAQRIREEQEQKARILHERKDQEKNKTREFLNLLSDYRSANEIREFVGVLKKIGQTDDDSIRWMLNKAEWIEVSIDDELLGKREHHKTDKEKEEFLKVERYYW